MSILNILLLLSILILSPLTHALEEALGTPTTVSTSPIAVHIAQADPATLLEAALQLREAKPALFEGAQGVLIVNVVPGSQAAEKGLQPGDIVIAYAGEAMNSVDQLIEAVQAKVSESQVVLRFIRGEKVKEVGMKGGKMGVELNDITYETLLASNPFLKEFSASIKDRDFLAASELLKGNPDVSEKLHQLLTRLGKGTGEKAKQFQAMAELFGKFRQLPNIVNVDLERLHTEGSQAFNKSDYSTAMEKWQVGLTHAHEVDNKVYIGSFLTNIGLVYQNLGQHSQSLNSYQQALRIYREIGDKSGEGDILNRIGSVLYYTLSQGSQALEYYRQALVIVHDAGDKQEESNILNNIGNVYSNFLGQYSQSLDYLQQSLVINRDLGNKGGESIVLNNISSTYYKLNEYIKALDYSQQALAIARNINDKSNEADALASIGNVYHQLGQYSQALDYFLQALLITHNFEENPERESSVLNNIGNVYDKLGQYSMSLNYLQRALAIVTQNIGDKRGQARILNNIGNVYQEIGQYPEALDHRQQALAIAREIDDKQGEGDRLSGLGALYGSLGQYPKALEYNQQAFAIHRELGDKHGEGIDLFNLGLIYGILGQYDKAKTHFQDSITIHKSLGSLDSLWGAQGGLAAIRVLLKQPKDAIYHLEQALDIIEQLRASLTSDMEKHTGIQTRDLKTNFMQNKFFVYDELINLYHDQGDDQKSFETFERKQGRAFLEDMAKSGVRRYVDLPVATSQKEETLETQLEAARKILGEAADKGDEAVKSARELLATAETARDAFQEAELKVKYPHYYALKHPQPVKLPDLQQNVLQEGELLLIYNVRKAATDLWLVGKQHFQMFSLSVTEAQVKEKVETFRKWGIDRADTDNSQALADSLKKDFTDFTQASQALYQQLFPATVRTLLGEAKPKLLYIVPTSALYELPFEALVTENTDKPHYLLQDYAISYLSSASLLKTLREAKSKDKKSQQEKEKEKEERQPLLAFADPVYPIQDCQPTDDSLLAQQVRDYYALLIGGGLDEKSGCPKKLPSEALSIINSLELEEDSEPPFLIRGNDASRQTLLTMNSKGQLEDSKYVVFSTHGLVPNKITPLTQPALLLSHTTPLEQEKDEDGEMVLKGFLTMSDVFRLKMNTDLVMLSACNTGLGETIKGEGTIGLTRAFMYAGTPAVSITLWSIEARAAKKLNVAWFNRLKEGQPLADSLREAKLEMLDKSGYYRYPYAWAGVVVFGDGK